MRQKVSVIPNFKLGYSHQIGSSSRAHHIDATTPQGLLDIVILGSMLEVCWVYDEKVSKTEELPRRISKQAFDAFKTLFNDRQQIVMDNETGDPKKLIFDRYLLQLAVSLVHYSKVEEGSAKVVGPKVRQHIKRHHEHLLSTFEMDINSDFMPYTRTFDWTGPTFDIIPRACESEMFNIFFLLIFLDLEHWENQ